MIPFVWWTIISGLKKKADFIFVLSDKGNPLFFQLCDSVYVISDNSLSMTDYIKNIIRGTDRLDGVIFRDVTDNGITGKYVVNHIIKDEYLVKLLKKGYVYEILDDEIDREYKISLAYEGISDFKRLSSGFLQVLSKIAQRLTEAKVQDIDKALSKAKEGKIIEYSILE